MLAMATPTPPARSVRLDACAGAALTALALAVALAPSLRAPAAPTASAQEPPIEARSYLPYLPGALPPPRPAPVPSATPASPTTEPTPATTAPTPPASATPTGTAPTPIVPACERTTGDLGGLRLSLDGGRTVLPGARGLPAVAYTWALVPAASDPSDLVELHEGRLFQSTDGGCTLTEVAGVPQGPWTDMARAPSDPRVWVLSSVFAPQTAYTFDGGATWEADGLPEDAVHLAIHPTEPQRWQFVGRNPVRYERSSPSVRWSAHPIDVPQGQQVVSASHADHAGGTAWLVGTSTAGVFRSDDGERWEPASEGLWGEVGSPGEPVTAVVASWVALAPSDPRIGYAVVNRVGRSASLRAIARTDDGGRAWTRLVADGDEVGGVRVHVTGGTRVFVHPHDPLRALFAFGSYIEGYGVDLFRSRDGLATLQVAHLDGFYEVLALAFGASPDVLYVGASSDVPALEAR
jgi:hypothetical protein